MNWTKQRGELVDLAAQEINIEDIVIQDSFKSFPPSTHKIAKCYGCYRKNKVFDRDIIINKDNVLTDGYVAYLVAKMFDIKQVPIVAFDSELQELSAKE